MKIIPIIYWKKVSANMKADNTTVEKQKRAWNRYPDIVPPDVPKSEDFGIDYEIKYRLPNGTIATTTTEWLVERKWNLRYPYEVIAWREENKIIQFPGKNQEPDEEIEREE